MPSDDDGLSDSDFDDDFNEDMEALRKACLLSGADPEDCDIPSPRGSGELRGGATSTAPTSSDFDFDEEVDDMELVRKIQKRFEMSNGVGDEEPLSLTPLCTISHDEAEDDFETLRAIQRRFSSYNEDEPKDMLSYADCWTESRDDLLNDTEQVGATNITSEKETSTNFFLERTNAGEGFRPCVDASTGATGSADMNNDATIDAPSSSLIEWHESGGIEVPRSSAKPSCFPKSGQAFVDAIKKNRSCQKLIRSKLMQIESRVEEINKLKERVKILKDFQISCKKKTGRALSQKKDARVQLISVAKPRVNAKMLEKKVSSLYFGPPENPHVGAYKAVLAKNPISLNRERWLKEEKENLAKGVRQQFQEMLLRRSVDGLSGIDVLSGESTDVDSIIASIKDLDVTPEIMRLFLPMVNWAQVASMYVPGRSGAECQTRWLNSEDPLINHKIWTVEEDKNLLHIIQQKGISNWVDIAVSLGTNRTPFQCLARYQRSLNASIIKREWTEEEDNQLRAAVENFGEGNWQRVASTIEGRTGTQCSNRWIKTLHPVRQRVGKWSCDEDKRLRVAVMLFGAKTWRKVAQYVPGRTHVQCRERWVNCLDPSLNLDRWTKEEDSKLRAGIEEHGYCWSKVAACVPPRTDSQCRRRWKILFPHEVPLLQEAKKIQKAALISNFVDRESERPALGPKDFLPPRPEVLLPESQNSRPSGKRQSRTIAESKNSGPTGKCKIRSRRKGEQNGEAPSSSRSTVEIRQLTDGIVLENSSEAVVSLHKSGKRCTKLQECSRTMHGSAPNLDRATLSMTNGEEVGVLAGGMVPENNGFRAGLTNLNQREAVHDQRTTVSCRVENGGYVPESDYSSYFSDPGLLRTANGAAVDASDIIAASNTVVSKLHPRKCRSKPQRSRCPSDAVMEAGVTSVEYNNVKMKGIKFDVKKRKGTNGMQDPSSHLPIINSFIGTENRVDDLGENECQKMGRKFQKTSLRNDFTEISTSPFLSTNSVSSGTQDFNGNGKEKIACLTSTSGVVGIFPDQHRKRSLCIEQLNEVEGLSLSPEFDSEHHIAESIGTGENSQLHSSSLRCSTPDIIESSSYRTPDGCLGADLKSSSFLDAACLSRTSEAEEDDSMTLASSILKSTAHKNSTSSSKSNLRFKNAKHNTRIANKSASHIKCYKRVRKGDGASLRPILEAEVPDDTILAHFCKKQKRKIDLAQV